MIEILKTRPSRFLLSILLPLLFTVVVSCTDQHISSFGLEARDLVISREKGGEKADPPVFSSGEDVYIQFEFSEYDLDANGNAWIQEDLTMISKGGKIVLNEANIINERIKPPEGLEWWPVNNKITLPLIIETGDATIEINIRDKIGGGTIYIKTKIEVK